MNNNAISSLVTQWNPSADILDSTLTIEKKHLRGKRNSTIDPEVAICRNAHTINEYLDRTEFFSSRQLKDSLTDLATLFGRMVVKCPLAIDWENQKDLYELGKKTLLSALQLQENKQFEEVLEKNIPLPLIVTIMKFTSSEKQPELYDYIFNHYAVIHEESFSIRPQLKQLMNEKLLSDFIEYVTYSRRLIYIPITIDRKAIFKETMGISKSGNTLDAAQTKKMKEGTALLNQASLPPCHFHSKRVNTKYLIENSDTFDLMKKLIDAGYHPVGLNMANREEAGGGVAFGAPAQEESLFRRSNYFESLFLKENPHLRKQMNGRYQIPEFGLIYTPHIQVFRNNEKEEYSFCKPYSVDMIAAAAYDRRPLGDPVTDEQVEAGIKEKVRLILRCAHLKKHDAVVLGAWGCGAFLNDPHQIARLMKETLHEKEFLNLFRLIAFPILRMDYDQTDNLGVFQKTFQAPDLY